ncbi:MAG: DJ-1/PfpI family protein [Pseudomonadota bacterium]|nr:DJ-1/PfpI family protein [Pseudomonadota bacterium]
MSLAIGFVLFPGVTQLDFTGPLQVLSRIPNARCHIAAKTLDPVPTDCGLALVPTARFSECPPLDIICVPGGFGIVGAIGDKETLSFVRERGRAAKYVTSVCTGALVLGAAGLLRGKRATTHWAYRDLLPLAGARRSDERVCRDGNLFTGGGVTAGIDFAFTLAAEIAGRQVAETIQLGLEYDPAPPFAKGAPNLAAPQTLEHLINRYASPIEATRKAIENAMR